LKGKFTTKKENCDRTWRFYKIKKGTAWQFLSLMLVVKNYFFTALANESTILIESAILVAIANESAVACAVIAATESAAAVAFAIESIFIASFFANSSAEGPQDTKEVAKTATATIDNTFFIFVLFLKLFRLQK
jgi:hypothetical protein